MTKNIKQIEQELTKLKEEVSYCAEKLAEIYRKYLLTLHPLVSKEMILACYRLCTHIYPESFLQLPFSARQVLQQNLRRAVKNFSAIVIYYLRHLEEIEHLENLNFMEKMLQNLNKEEDSGSKSTNELAESREQPDSDLEARDFSYSKELEKMLKENSDQIPEYQKQAIKNIDNPLTLLRWQKLMEKSVAKSLEFISKLANEEFKKAKILPEQLPSKVIEIAVEAEQTNGSNPTYPHILHIVIETSPETKTKPEISTKVSIIKMSLAELEFSKPVLSYQRQEIRNLVSKISKIKQKYQKTYKELAIAQAQLAWRASWYED